MGELGSIPSEVAIPIDLPGNAARIAHCGAGEFIDDLTTERLSELIDKVLQDSSYRARV
jgi:UDP:flavonoid glycosyltransferase YjiC (YdhE family)